jgi:hypothetical protein
LPKGVLDPLLGAELPRHAVEGLRELPHLIPARHGNRHRQVAGLDGLGSIHHPPQGPHQPLGSHRAQAEADDHRDPEEDEIEAEDPRLLGVGGLGRVPGEGRQLVPQS